MAHSPTPAFSFIPSPPPNQNRARGCSSDDTIHNISLTEQPQETGFSVRGSLSSLDNDGQRLGIHRLDLAPRSSTVSALTGYDCPFEPPNVDQHHSVISRASYADKLVASWRLRGRSYAFVSLVVSLQVGLGVWQCYEYGNNMADQAALGWGVALAKGSAGALYPTLFFMLASMSRWLQTLMRRWGILSPCIVWDKFRSFHVKMAVCALILSVLHAIGHLTGSFVHASRGSSHAAVENLFGNNFNQVEYLDFIKSRPGWSGLSALAIFFMVGASSTNYARKRSFEAFQCLHFLIFPMLILLAIHGTTMLLHFPCLGFILAVPTILVLSEKISRAIQLLRPCHAEMEDLNDELSKVTIFPYKRSQGWLSANMGQLIFLHVPSISRLEWHPFTIAHASESNLQLYTKASGSWTRSLRELDDTCQVQIDGPFGGPCQSFFNYDHNIVIGTGIGATTSASILDGLRKCQDHPWTNQRRRAKMSANESSTTILDSQRHHLDIFWAMRDSRGLEWIHDTFFEAAACSHNSSIVFRSNTFLTSAKSAPLLQTDRMPLKQQLQDPDFPSIGTVSAPPPLATTCFARPDFQTILVKHYEKMKKLQSCPSISIRRSTRLRVGVFFCGDKSLQALVKALCYENTVRSIIEGPGFEYHFHPEVF